MNKLNKLAKEKKGYIGHGIVYGKEHFSFYSLDPNDRRNKRIFV